MVIDKTGLALGNQLVMELSPISTFIGGLPRESWLDLRDPQINEAGSYLVSAETVRPSAVDHVLLRDGRIWHRVGDVVDAETLDEGFASASLSDSNEVAFAWELVGPQLDRVALCFEDRILLRAGDAVDLDRDGVVEPSSRLSDIRKVRLSPLRDGMRYIYAIASVDVNGTASHFEDVEALLRVPVDSLHQDVRSTSLSFGVDVGLELDASPLEEGALYLVLSSLSGTAPGIALSANLVLPLNPDLYFAATTLGSGSAITNATGSLDANGDAIASFTLPAGTVLAGAVGLSVSHAFLALTPGGKLSASSPASFVLTP